ncbi:MAG: RagB/SusD family nutrient uptake outer membrane protein [Chitinophagaceae bacterium]|nr:MAG: RagB/SusD family nutrient uptake outer membrane protein [Chitinophagaceae bacterium]
MLNLKYLLAVTIAITTLLSCKKDYGNLNSPTVESVLTNATQSQLNNLVSGTESGMRNAISFYLDDIGTIGREGYRFSGSEPRYVTDLLGFNSGTLSNSNFYITNPWAARYRVVKNCNILIEAAGNSSLVTDNQKNGYIGFAKTIKAYQLLMNLNLTYSNGIRTDVNDPDNLGPVVGYDASLAAIAALLDEGKTSLTGAAVSFQLAGFDNLDDAAGLIKVNRAIAARVEVYRKNWPAALTALGESFFDLTGDLNAGVYHVFGTGSGDQLNPIFIPQNTNGETRVAHPSFAADIESGDDRIAKATLRSSTASLSNLSSDRDVWVYTSSTAPIPLIRNEELILIFAEASIQSSPGVAEDALNRIRTGHGLAAYSGPLTTVGLTDEMLRQRRYSLFYEGHRWVDLRRYGRLASLPTDRAGDDVWEEFPLPLTEQQ